VLAKRAEATSMGTLKLTSMLDAARTTLAWPMLTLST
jgi:hypothetical protein